ncbi:MAG: tripartite tricarboxylate transporter substrate binding protein [Burkholderiales bacterium]|nr:tripartite tricarboxylate transporter substrate binding protein [Burkholderiales bacterium]
MRLGKRLLAAISIALLLAGSVSHVAAQTWPTRPVRLVVSFPPGGGADAIARLLAPRIADGLGQSVVVENRGGGGGTIGADAVAKSAPDGYTFLLDASGHSVNPSLQPKMPFDTLKDLASVSLLVTVPNVLVVHPSFPAASVKEFIALVKGKPGQFSFASSGNGGAQHLAGELFKAQAGLFMVHIPYRGGGPALIDVMSNQVPIFFGNMASTLPHIRAGKLRPLGLTGRTRSPALPATPTIAEEGLKGYEVYEWNGVFAPAGTPADVVARMQREIARAMGLPEVRERLATLGAEPIASSAVELERFRRAEIEKWAAVIKRAGIKAD